MVITEWMLEAYFDCRHSKRTSASSIVYEMNYEEKLICLRDRINDRTYRPGKSICFVVTRPRYREVFAAAFEDRIVHHYIAIRLNPLFEKIFSPRTFNCRKGKGQLYGINILKQDIIECSNNYTEDCWILGLDLKGFFMSIIKRMLADMIDEFIVENYEGPDKEDLRFLVVLSYCTALRRIVSGIARRAIGTISTNQNRYSRMVRAEASLSAIFLPRSLLISSSTFLIGISRQRESITMADMWMISFVSARISKNY